jgi:Fe-S-cluster formation regulator IscX/YfhJ
MNHRLLIISHHETMPPYAADLETWWSGSGHDLIKELMDAVTDLDPRQCGFAQQIKWRLLSFDKDPTINAQIRRDWPAIRAARGIDYDANSRKYAKYIASTIFRKPEKGGIDFGLAMNGLGYLDAMEIRRLRLLKATNNAIQAAPTCEGRSQLLEELERTSSTNFKNLHAGLRICVRYASACGQNSVS